MNKIYSFVITHYKQQLFWQEAVDSVLAQDYSAIELVLVDDATPNFDKIKVMDYITSHKRDNIVSYSVIVNETNLGTVKSLNNIIPKLSGEYIQILAADDALFSSKVATSNANALADAAQGVMAVTTMARDYDSNTERCKGYSFDKKIGLKRNHMSQKELLDDIAVGCEYVGSSCAYKKEAFDTIGLFNEDYRLIKDAPFWVKLLKRGYSLHYCDYVSVKHRIDGKGYSQNKLHTRAQTEKQTEELIFLENDLLPLTKAMSYKHQKRAKNIYQRARDRHYEMERGMYFGLSDCALAEYLPKVKKEETKKRAIAKLENAVEGCKKACINTIKMWLLAAFSMYAGIVCNAGLVTNILAYVFNGLAVLILVQLLCLTVLLCANFGIKLFMRREQYCDE